MQQRRQAKDNAGRHRHDERESKHGGIDGNLGRPRQAVRVGRHQPTHPSPREHEPDCPTRECENAAFCGELGEETPPARTNRAPHGEFAMAGLGTREQEIGEVRAGDE